jgi:hypothetical protein
MTRMEIKIAKEILMKQAGMTGLVLLFALGHSLSVKLQRDESHVLQYLFWGMMLVAVFSTPWWRKRILKKKDCPKCGARNLKVEPINRNVVDVVKVRCSGCGKVCETDAQRRPWSGIWEMRG